MSEDGFYVVTATTDLAPGDQMHVELDGEDILLCNYRGKFYAVSYYCTHAFMPLEGGYLEDGCVSCPYHGAVFSLADGSVQMPPANGGLKIFPVRVEDDTVAVSATPLNDPA
ncbi:MAG: hypothetical protein CMQ29_00405 [Gammaproteobacteria bacterium]|nr:hypothetical protein [Gammaproteobacteria bacterium]